MYDSIVFIHIHAYLVQTNQLKGYIMIMLNAAYVSYRRLTHNILSLSIWQGALVSKSFEVMLIVSY